MFLSGNFIIKQIDKKVKMPPRYRGIDPDYNKSYGDLKYDINEVIPFSWDQTDDIVWLINTMRENGQNGTYPENLNKEFYILTVDDEGKVIKEESFDDWYYDAI